MPIVPNDNDVLLGRGQIIMTHPGNERLRQLVRSHKASFDRSKKHEKRRVALQIADAIRSHGGRFLMEDPQHANRCSNICDKVWILAEEEKALKKVMHRLREKERGDENGAGGSVGSGREYAAVGPAPGIFPGNVEGSVGQQPMGHRGFMSAAQFTGMAGSVPPANSTMMGTRQAVGSAGQMGVFLSPPNMAQQVGCLGSGRASSSPLGNVPFPEMNGTSITKNETGAVAAVGHRASSQPGASRDSVAGMGKGPSSPRPWNERPIGLSGPNILNESLHAVDSVAGAAEGSSASPMSLHAWVELASKLPQTTYLAASIDLAARIAQHLRDLVGAATALNPRDTAAENFVVLVEPGGPSVRGVNLVSVLEPSVVPPERTPLREREACALLGRILLVVFGLDEGSLDASIQRDSASEDGMPPAPKRRSMETGSTLLNPMPSSIHHLVQDLLRAENEERTSTSLSSLDEALWDLAKMETDPESFLHDRTCPESALDHFYSLDENVFGRDKEIGALMRAKRSISSFVGANDSATFCVESDDSCGGGGFLCEAAFVCGYAGSGKSTLLLPLMDACVEESWFVLRCKFDKQAAPIKVLFKAFDDFFGRWGDPINSSLKESFSQACRQIVSTVDNAGMSQLVELFPNFAKHSPFLTRRSISPEHVGVSSMDKVGSAQTRLQKLIHVIIESFCSAGRPMLFIVDDLQWCDSFVLDSITSCIYGTACSCIGGEGSRQGLFLSGTYRSNEVTEGHPLIESINCLKNSQKANVTMLKIGELAKCDVTKLISTKLCLPWRHTRELAGVVHSKTRGNPFFINQFLRSIVSNKMLEFSIKSRRWVWDCDVVDMQMMPDGVAALLTSSFNRLPEGLMQAMKVVSCLGYQVERPTIDALDSTKEVLPFSILDELQLAVKEGILEKAGPMYQFTHDIIQQTVYELIPSGDRKILHKLIGQSLLKSARNSPAIHLLAVDQINIFCKDSVLIPEERSDFAHSNAQAAKYAISSSSFKQARFYIDIGMRLLEPNHWETQYPLSLSLYEMSASVSCISGDSATMSSCLDQVLSHVMTFEDSLKASSMLVKLLASNSKYEEARSNCFMILKNLGEEFPPNISPPLVKKEMPAMQTVLRNVTYDRIKALPSMTDSSKRNAMKFLNMLCMYSVQSKPPLVPLLSCRMVRLTLQYGFCEDAIVGIATAGHSIFLFTEDIQLATHIGKVSELLIEESPKRHLLRSRLCRELFTTLKMMNEPNHCVIARYPKLHNSAMLAGDFENAVTCCFACCASGLWTAPFPLSSLLRRLKKCIREASKYQQNTMKYSAMALYHACMFLTGQKNDELEIKSLGELNAIGVETKSVPIIFHTFMCGFSRCFWMRDFSQLAEISEKYSEKHPTLQQKRFLQVVRIFCEGIAYLNLARNTNQPKWRALGEKALASISHFEVTMSKWNFENKSLLLQAELHYLNGDIESADTAYEASIKSAHDHKFIHEEALAYELHGRFSVENNMGRIGQEQLRLALAKYKEWGATTKVDKLQRYMHALGYAEA